MTEQPVIPTASNAEHVRLLQCFTCKSVEVMPDYEGNPDLDVVLHTLDERHGGHTQQPHHRALHRVEKRVWEDRAAKRHIVDQMWSGETGFKPSYYDVKDTLQEDAVKCFNEHRRQIPCIDWRDDSKRLKAPTTSMRQQLAKDMPRSFHGDRDRIAHGAPTVHLCSFCPVQVAVDHAKRKARGEA